jgi:enamine deaminase RidA (YjgF/YER057c/UK114 family)
VPAERDPIARFGSGGPWEAGFGYSRVVRAGALVLVAGSTSVSEDGVVRAPGDAYAQTHYAFDAIEEGLNAAGARLDQVVRTRMFVTDMARAAEVGRAHGERFGTIRPVTSMVGVTALIDPRMLVEVEAEAYIG